jgi:hypothetical protein
MAQDFLPSIHWVCFPLMVRQRLRRRALPDRAHIVAFRSGGPATADTLAHSPADHGDLLPGGGYGSRWLLQRSIAAITGASGAIDDILAPRGMGETVRA